MARQYKRDARGRFASGGSSGRRPGGTLAARASLRRSRQKLASRDPADTSLKGSLSGRAQRAAVTRANKRLQQASRSSRVSIAGGRGGTLRRPKGYKPPGGRAAASAQLKNYLGRTSQAPDPAFVRQQASKPRAEPLTLGGGTLAARGSLKRSRAKLRENDTPSQRGAVTRANRYARMAIKRERVTLGQSVKGRFVRGKRSQPAAATPTARPKVPARGTLAARSRLGQARRDAAADFNPSTARALTKYNREAAVEARLSRRRIRQSPAGRFVRGKGGKGQPGALAKRTPELMPTTVMPRAGSTRKEPRIADAMRENLRKLAEADARFLRDMEREFGIKFPVPKEKPTKRLPPPPSGTQSGGKDVKISTLIRDNLRRLAQSDAEMLREIDALTRNIPKGPLRGSGSTRKIGGSKPRLSGGKSKPPGKGKPRGKGKPKG